MFTFEPISPFQTAPYTDESKWQKAEKIISKISRCVNAALPAVKTVAKGIEKASHRRTDEELESCYTDTDKRPKEFQHEQGIPLSVAIYSADNRPGVYVLRLNGQVMKCGRASYDKGSSCGVAWRLRQYYNLCYDDRSRKGECWSVNSGNRDKITVSWQCCPVSKCHELEYKLFKKYGKGPWAHRAPISCGQDSWKLLI